MKVKDLIKELSKIKNKNSDIDVILEVGYGDFVGCDSGISISIDDDGIVVINGVGSWL